MNTSRADKIVASYDDIDYVIGDILEALDDGFIDVLVHQTNCRGIMGAGIAKAIAEKYPEVEEADRKMSLMGADEIAGSIHSVYVEDGWVVNLYGQTNPGISKEYDLIEQGLINLRRYILITDPNVVIGFPLIGCGIAGGDWGIVSDLIKKHMDGLLFYVFCLDDETLKTTIKGMKK